VARAISRRGITARPIIEEGGKASEGRVIVAMQTAVKKALDKLAYKGK
jgi:hypothetical protein